VGFTDGGGVAVQTNSPPLDEIVRKRVARTDATARYIQKRCDYTPSRRLMENPSRRDYMCEKQSESITTVEFQKKCKSVLRDRITLLTMQTNRN